MPDLLLLPRFHGALHFRMAAAALAVSIIGTSCSRPPPPTNDAEVGFSGEDDADSPQGPFRTYILNVGGGEILLRIAPGELRVSDEALRAWVAASAKAVAGYFGRFPVRKVRITLVVGGNGTINNGMTSEAGIRVGVGQRTRQADLDADWVMTHEMFHLAFPDLDEQYNWLSEGLASYLEPLARVRLGALTPEKVWGDLVEGMPQGQPGPGDKGLDRTHTWGRTYWGGAMFCLLADVEIREKTQNRKSLDDAMRAILDAGGNVTQHWTLD